MGAIMRRKLLVLLCGLVAVAFVSAAWGADPNTDGWEFKAAPYIWAVSLDGDMTVKGDTVADQGVSAHSGDGHPVLSGGHERAGHRFE